MFRKVSVFAAVVLALLASNEAATPAAAAKVRDHPANKGTPPPRSPLTALGGARRFKPVGGVVAHGGKAHHHRPPHHHKKVAAAGVKATTGSGGGLKVILDVPPRYMWGWGDPSLSGYCGETSLQSSLLYHGAWVSSELVRYAAGNEELLIGVNAAKAAKALQLDYTEKDVLSSFDSDDYLMDFVVPAIDSGSVVVFGFFIQEPSGDSDYDHIMPIHGYELNAANSQVDVIYFNDLFLNETRALSRYTKSGATNAYFQATRKQCKTSQDVENPFDYCMPSNHAYSISIKSIKGEAYVKRAFLNVGAWTEPDWGAEDGLHQNPVRFNATLTVSGLDAGTSYSVLRYEDATDVPTTNNFAESSYVGRHDFTATSDTQQLHHFDSFMSDDMVYYRVVNSDLLATTKKVNKKVVKGKRSFIESMEKLYGKKMQ